MVWDNPKLMGDHLRSPSEEDHAARPEDGFERAQSQDETSRVVRTTLRKVNRGAYAVQDGRKEEARGSLLGVATAMIRSASRVLNRRAVPMGTAPISQVQSPTSEFTGQTTPSVPKNTTPNTPTYPSQVPTPLQSKTKTPVNTLSGKDASSVHYATSTVHAFSEVSNALTPTKASPLSTLPEPASTNLDAPASESSNEHTPSMLYSQSTIPSLTATAANPITPESSVEPTTPALDSPSFMPSSGSTTAASSTEQMLTGLSSVPAKPGPLSTTASQIIPESSTEPVPTTLSPLSTVLNPLDTTASPSIPESSVEDTGLTVQKPLATTIASPTSPIAPVLWTEYTPTKSSRPLTGLSHVSAITGLATDLSSAHSPSRSSSLPTNAGASDMVNSLITESSLKRTFIKSQSVLTSRPITIIVSSPITGSVSTPKSPLSTPNSQTVTAGHNTAKPSIPSSPSRASTSSLFGSTSTHRSWTTSQKPSLSPSQSTLVRTSKTPQTSPAISKNSRTSSHAGTLTEPRDTSQSGSWTGPPSSEISKTTPATSPNHPHETSVPSSGASSSDDSFAPGAHISSHGLPSNASPTAASSAVTKASSGSQSYTVIVSVTTATAPLGTQRTTQASQTDQYSANTGIGLSSQVTTNARSSSTPKERSRTSAKTPQQTHDFMSTASETSQVVSSAKLTVTVTPTSSVHTPSPSYNVKQSTVTHETLMSPFFSPSRSSTAKPTASHPTLTSPASPLSVTISGTSTASRTYSSPATYKSRALSRTLEHSTGISSISRILSKPSAFAETKSRHPAMPSAMSVHAEPTSISSRPAQPSASTPPIVIPPLVTTTEQIPTTESNELPTSEQRNTATSELTPPTHILPPLPSTASSKSSAQSQSSSEPPVIQPPPVSLTTPPTASPEPDTISSSSITPPPIITPPHLTTSDSISTTSRFTDSGAISSTYSLSSSSNTSTSTPSSTAAVIVPVSHTNHAGQIAGGVVGGIAGLALLAAAAFMLWRMLAGKSAAGAAANGAGGTAAAGGGGGDDAAAAPATGAGGTAQASHGGSGFTSASPAAADPSNGAYAGYPSYDHYIAAAAQAGYNPVVAGPWYGNYDPAALDAAYGAAAAAGMVGGAAAYAAGHSPDQGYYYSDPFYSHDGHLGKAGGEGSQTSEVAPAYASRVPSDTGVGVASEMASNPAGPGSGISSGMLGAALAGAATAAGSTALARHACRYTTTSPAASAGGGGPRSFQKLCGRKLSPAIESGKTGFDPFIGAGEKPSGAAAASIAAGAGAGAGAGASAAFTRSPHQSLTNSEIDAFTGERSRHSNSSLSAHSLRNHQAIDIPLPTPFMTSKRGSRNSNRSDNTASLFRNPSDAGSANTLSSDDGGDHSQLCAGTAVAVPVVRASPARNITEDSMTLAPEMSSGQAAAISGGDDYGLSGDEDTISAYYDNHDDHGDDGRYRHSRELNGLLRRSN